MIQSGFLRILSFYLIVAATSLATAQDVLWARRLEHLGNHGIGVDVATDVQGNVYAVGTTSDSIGVDILAVKYSSTGQRLWVRYYNSPSQLRDVAQAVAVTPDGNVFVTG